MRRLWLLVGVVACASAEGDGPAPRPTAPPPPSRSHIDQLIEDLGEVAESGIGYSPTMTGAVFLPVPDTEEQGMLLLGQAPPQPSTTLAEIVAAGASAVPALIDCLDDDKETKLPPMKAMMWTQFGREYDYNRRTTEQPALLSKPEGDLGVDAPQEIRVTRGGLCFVALGQIVSRSFAAVRYQPTGGLVVNSPPRNPALRETVIAEWGGLTEASHRASLILDFERPDYAYRREAAAVRLAYYYPDTLTPLMKAALTRPTYDPDVVQDFMRSLYPLSREARERRFAAFVRKHGEAGKDGLKIALFDDLDMQQHHEAGTVSPPETGAGYRARECLIELFGYPKDVKAQDVPFAEYMSKYEHERLAKLAPAP